MFSISFTPPSRPDPNQRDNYFLGQETGFKQMAEVAADRNQKRNIELNRQQLDLARQQESRAARENAARIDLARRQQAIAEKVLPLEIASRRADITKTLNDIDIAREELSRSADNSNIFRNISQALMSGGQRSSFARESLETPKQEQTQRMAAPEPTKVKEEPAKIEEVPLRRSSQFDRGISSALLVDSIGSWDKRTDLTEEKTAKEQKAGIERTNIMLGRTPVVSQGFGISQKGWKDFLYEYDDRV